MLTLSTLHDKAKEIAEKISAPAKESYSRAGIETLVNDTFKTDMEQTAEAFNTAENRANSAIKEREDAQNECLRLRRQVDILKQPIVAIRELVDKPEVKDIA